MWRTFLMTVGALALSKNFQVRIAWGNSDTSMLVTWAAGPRTSDQYVEYAEFDPSTGQISNTMSAIGVPEEFYNTPGNRYSRKLYTSWAELKNLKPGYFYKYRVWANEYSDYFMFRAKRDFSIESEARFLVYGDLGVGTEIRETIDNLEKETISYQHDAIIHVGDFAYDLNTNNGYKGDEFFEAISPIASRIPYMAAQGNHEGPDSGTTEHYQKRFKMPGDSTNFWYSFNAGKAHIVAISTEFVIQKQTDLDNAQKQWLKADLSSYNRTEYPWLVIYGHRPMYCSADWTIKHNLNAVPFERHNVDCTDSGPKVAAGYEELFYDAKADLLLFGHVHAYERFGPAYRNHSMPSQFSDPHTFVNPQAPIQIISGVPGQDESYAPVSKTPLPFSLFQSDEKGYGRLTILNSTHLHWEQVTSSNGQVIDYVWLVKEP